MITHAQIMIDTIQHLFVKHREGAVEFFKTLEITPKGFFHHQSSPPRFFLLQGRVLDGQSGLSKHIGRNGKVKQSVLLVVLVPFSFLLLNGARQGAPGVLVSVGLASLVVANVQKGFHHLLGMVALFQKGTQAVAELVVSEAGPSVSVDDRVVR